MEGFVWLDDDRTVKDECQMALRSGSIVVHRDVMAVGINIVGQAASSTC